MTNQFDLFAPPSQATTGIVRINLEDVSVEIKPGYGIVTDADGWNLIADNATGERLLPSYAVQRGIAKVVK